MKPALDGYLKDYEGTSDAKPKKDDIAETSSSGLPAAGKDLRYIKEHEDDTRVWNKPRQPSDRKNDWHPNVDTCMFNV